MYAKVILPASILAGTVVGAGFFALPFVFQKSGALTGLFYLLTLTLLLAVSYLFYADVIVRTPGEHRFVGYAQIYLGKWGYWLTIIMGLIPLVFALTIYLILAPSFSRLFIEGNYVYHLLIFWLAGSIAILLKTRRIAFIEFLIVAGTVLIIFLVFGLGIGKLSGSEINWLPFNILNLTAIGPVLFAMAGDAAVPEMISYFRESGLTVKFFPNSLFVGMIVPAIAFFAFVLGVLSLSPIVSEDAVTGLIGRIPDLVLAAIGVLGLISLLSSYIVLGLNARRVFLYDLKWPDWLSRALIIILPPAFYFLGFQSFISLVSNIGGIFVPLGGALGIWIWYRANRKLRQPPVFVGQYLKIARPILMAIFLFISIYFLVNNR
jgi:amino acid permease